MESLHHIYQKREKCKNEDPAFDACERYVSEFTKTGIPLIIGLSLFLVVGTLVFFIVRRQRRRQDAAERAKERMIDDNVELTWIPVANKSNDDGHQFSLPGSEEKHTAPPPYPAQVYPPKAYRKDRGRRGSRDSDYV